MFIAKVQAEIKAQYNDQSFVNRVCQHTDNVEQLTTLRGQAYYRKEKVAPFLHACHILAESMNNSSFSKEDRSVCASLLAQRLENASSDQAFRMRHIMIFGDLEEKVQEWGRVNGFT